ncbi:hypothetical protein GCM10017600_15860 [Streptosporangium carneum]|uniref:Uncharacterized protein n=1 Tax=Streptosporangium carneum TaxID=47481 RepID=A0A9W6HYM5_9ACTN|nr:hypothetical protein GCM10017600_15860 [Streptosporangium carneum]
MAGAGGAAGVGSRCGGGGRVNSWLGGAAGVGFGVGTVSRGVGGEEGGLAGGRERLVSAEFVSEVAGWTFVCWGRSA